ncbi:MAG: aminoacyl-tRNA hydrolase [Bacteroidales bacterium]|nr:aminoacyl-tRNA hydrolase [Bacteroidales bacterium]
MKYLIVGLGNPGEKYSETRHNIGFKVLDAFAEASDAVFEHKRYADVTKVKHKGRIFVLAKPMTFMNLSGKAVDYWIKKEKVPVENTLIIVDDLALDFGTIRLKNKGGDGGHNGLNDIITVLGHQNFNRLRFGIGDSYSKGRQVDYVLDDWSENEQKLLPERIKKMIGAIKSFGTIGIERTMNFFNKKYDIETELLKLKKKDGEVK